ncbi:succinylglutamate-semialdehyde dehydrogenase [Bacterioplanoides sp.]|uniref:succinylglutamate-semialdehyde dehydrogenase n=1 Tax=Bacterioplanoides sp. TaxID=2066072 RepID=UPI003B5CF9C9
MNISDKGLFINGNWLNGEGPVLTSSNPSSGEVIWQKNQAAKHQVEQAFVAASSYVGRWRNIGLTERILIIQTFTQLLRDNQESLATLLSKENGKPLWEARTEIAACINKTDISISAQQNRCADTNKNPYRLVHQPLGVVVVISPYNFPFHLANGHIVPALLAGNCILLKPSEHTPACAEFMVQLWHQAGLPAGVINLLPGGSEVSEALLLQPVNAVLFTGSSQTGRIIHKALAGRPEVLLALEMGGNNPLIVDAYDKPYSDNERNQISDLIIRSAFISSGQRCTCSRRLIIIDNQENRELLNNLVLRCQKLRVSTTDGKECQSFIGPLISPHAANKVRQQYQHLESLGGKKLLEPQDLEPDTLVSPAVIDMSSVPQSIIPDEEIFGPVLQVFWVDDINQAIQHANATQYGLAAGLVSQNIVHQQQFQQHINAGFFTINKPTTGAPSTLPFGGTGVSGNHRPSAYYAADYCAWPQASALAEAIEDSVKISQVDL